jgi:hypothetical protein
MHGPICIFWANQTPFSLQKSPGGAAQKGPKKMDQKARDNKTIQMLKDTVAKLKQDSASTKLKQSLLKNSELEKEIADLKEKAGSKPADPDQSDGKPTPAPISELTTKPAPAPESEPEPEAKQKDDSAVPSTQA